MKNKRAQIQTQCIMKRKNKNENSKGVEKLFELADSYLQDTEKVIQQGKDAIWGGGSWEAPLTYACDTIPIPLSELWRSKSQEAANIGEDYFQIPGEFCSMIKAALGRLYLRKGNINRILCFSAGCEPVNVALELIKKEGYDVHYIDSVSIHKNDKVSYEQGVTFLVNELDDVARWLTGKELNEEKLKLEIKRKNEVIRKTKRILDLRLGSPDYLPAQPTLQLLLGAGHYFGRYEEYIRVLNLLIEELEDAAANGEKQKEVIPLVFAGGGGNAGQIFNTIEEGGGAILGWVSFTSFDRYYSEDIPPLESLARYLLDGQLAGELGELGGGAAILRRKRIEEEVRKTNACGIILYGITGCPYATIVRQMEREYFQKQEIPIISLEGTVHKEPPTEEQLTMVRTFVEMLS